MTANVDAMVRAGVEAYRAGKRAEARTLLERALELDQYNELAWMWLSAVVDTPEEQRTCLENVVVINPENERAKQGLRSLGVDPDSIINAEASAPEEPAIDDFQQEDLFASEIDSSPGSAASNAFGTDDLFGDFSADQPFEFDDNLFAEDSDDAYAEEDYLDDADYGDASYIDDDYDPDADHDGDEFYADINTLDEFAAAVSSGDMDDYDESLFERDPYYVAPEPDEDDAPDPQELFRRIPAAIEIQRLPGTDEKAPTQHYLIMGGLGVLNLIALIFLLMQFVG